MLLTSIDIVNIEWQLLVVWPRKLLLVLKKLYYTGDSLTFKDNISSFAPSKGHSR